MSAQSARDEDARGVEHSLVEGLSNAASQSQGHLSRDEIDDLLGVRTFSLADGHPKGRDDASIGAEGGPDTAETAGEQAAFTRTAATSTAGPDEVSGPDGTVSSRG